MEVDQPTGQHLATHDQDQMFVQGSSTGSGSICDAQYLDMEVDQPTGQHLAAPMSPSPLLLSIAPPSPIYLNSAIMNAPSHLPFQLLTTSETKRVIYVPDPHYIVDIKRAKENTGWSVFFITKEEFKMINIKGNLGLFKTKDKSKDANYPVAVLMNEWVCAQPQFKYGRLLTFSKLYLALLICRSGQGLDLQIIPWDVFKTDWILAENPTPDMTRLIEGGYIFLGGIDWSVNYL
jgi:hypothetical protein